MVDVFTGEHDRLVGAMNSSDILPDGRVCSSVQLVLIGGSNAWSEVRGLSGGVNCRIDGIDTDAATTILGIVGSLWESPWRNMNTIDEVRSV